MICEACGNPPINNRYYAEALDFINAFDDAKRAGLFMNEARERYFKTTGMRPEDVAANWETYAAATRRDHECRQHLFTVSERLREALR